MSKNIMVLDYREDFGNTDVTCDCCGDELHLDCILYPSIQGERVIEAAEEEVKTILKAVQDLEDYETYFPLHEDKPLTVVQVAAMTQIDLEAEPCADPTTRPSRGYYFSVGQEMVREKKENK